MSFIHTFERALARILVRLNPKEGLAESIRLEYGEYVFLQALDYEHLPFRCYRCHDYGHLAMECPMGNRRRRPQNSEEQREKKMRREQAFEEMEAQRDAVVEEGIKNSGKTNSAGEPSKSEALKDQFSPLSDIKERNAGDPAGDTADTLVDPSGTNQNLLLTPQSPDLCINTINVSSDIRKDVNKPVGNLCESIPISDQHCEDVSNHSQQNFPSPQSSHYNLRSLVKRQGKSIESVDPIGGLGPSLPQP